MTRWPNGRAAEDQYARLLDAAERCWVGARAVKGLDATVRAFEACNAISAQADFVCAHLAEIDKAIFGAPGLPHDTPKSPIQASSDKVYDGTYWQKFGEDRDALMKEYNELLAAMKSDESQGTPSQRARARALFDLIQGNPYSPPFLRP